MRQKNDARHSYKKVFMRYIFREAYWFNVYKGWNNVSLTRQLERKYVRKREMLTFDL